MYIMPELKSNTLLFKLGTSWCIQITIKQLLNKQNVKLHQRRTVTTVVFYAGRVLEECLVIYLGAVDAESTYSTLLKDSLI